MPSALSHDPSISTPGASTDNAIVIFDGTGGTGFGNSTILVDSGGNGRIGIAAGLDGHRALALLAECEDTDLPSDRYFRDAWEWED